MKKIQVLLLTDGFYIERDKKGAFYNKCSTESYLLVHKLDSIGMDKASYLLIMAAIVKIYIDNL